MASRRPRRRSRVPSRRSFRLQRARAADLPILVVHRVAMFRAIGHHTEAQLRGHALPYRRWLSPRLRSGEIVAYLATLEGRPVGSGALWFMPQQPRPGSPRGVVPYIMSMFTEPGHQRQGVATAIVRALVREARRARAQRVTLHAAPQGRPVYERLGFEVGNEMRLWLRRPAWTPTTGSRATTRARAGSPR